MQMHSSYCVTDPKGTIVLECGKMLEDNGYEIKILNTINFKKSMKYNPFAYLRSEKDILKLVQTIIANTKGEGEKAGEDFWVKAEKLYYTALIGYIWYEAPREEKNFATLLDMIDASEVREDDETYMNPIDRLFEALEKKEPTHFAVKQYKKYKLAAGASISFFLLIGMFCVNVKIGFLTLVCLIFIWFCVFLMVNQSKKEVAREHAAITGVSDALVDSIRGIPVLRSFPMADTGVVEEIHSGLKDSSEELRLAQVHFEIVFVIYSRIFTTIINLSSLLVTLFSCYLCTKGEVLLPQALTVSAAGFMIFGGLRQLENAAILMVKNPANMQYGRGFGHS